MLLEKIKKHICKVEWQVAIRENKINALDFSIDESCFTPIPNNSRYWAADPFVIEFRNKTLLFVELYDRLKRKGLIGYMDISAGVACRYKVVFEASCHLSYPMVYINEGKLFCIPESNNLGKLLVLKWNEALEKFDQVNTFMDGVRLADTNFVMWNDKTYMLSTPVDNSDNVSRLLLYKHNGNMDFIPCINNPVVIDKSVARNGGQIRKKGDGCLYRISQDCSKGYGEGLNILRIDEMSELSYNETLIKKINPSDISILDNKNIDGIHTYNSCRKWEVIDFKINYQFSIVEVLGFFLCSLKKIAKRCIPSLSQNLK